MAGCSALRLPLATISAEWATGAHARPMLNAKVIAITALSLLLGTISFLFDTPPVLRQNTVPFHILLAMRCLLPRLRE